MRLFTALDISDEVRTNLRRFVTRLKPFAKLQWSPLENLHITTKFIGEWPEKRLDELKSALGRVPKANQVDISIRGIGWFPNSRRPRVFWAGVEAGDSLHALAVGTETATAALGVPAEDRVYSPHLTLARIREPISLDALREEIAAISCDMCNTEPPGPPVSIQFDFGSFRATAFFLYLSMGGRYSKLAEFPLGSRSGT